MTRNRKGRAGWHQATLTNSPGVNLDARRAPAGGAPGKVRINTSKHARNFTGLAARIKAVIVTLALWGLLPVTVADWLINLGGQRDV